MANVRGPRPSKRRLLMSVTQSIMLYGAEIWADALKKETYRRRLAAVQQRGAFRIACSYRTVSEQAILVIAGTIPIDLLALEKKQVFHRKPEVTIGTAKDEARALTMERWQQRWSNDHRGRWTARLIPQLDTWVGRKHGETNYHMTQFFSGHGYFRSYLYKRGKVSSAICGYCEAEIDDANHTFFECDSWATLRHGLYIVGGMLQSEERWDRVASFVETIL